MLTVCTVPLRAELGQSVLELLSPSLGSSELGCIDLGLETSPAVAAHVVLKEVDLQSRS